jgi:hypothetical protein
MGEAFKPLGVYINFFQPRLAPSSTRTFKVMLVNDEYKPVAGKVVLSLETEKGQVVAQAEHDFDIKALGDQTVEISLAVPDVTGKHILKAKAQPAGNGASTLSRRWVKVERVGQQASN